MSGLQATQTESGSQPVGRLHPLYCQIRAIASRITTAVIGVFQAIARIISKSYHCLRNRVICARLSSCLIFVPVHERSNMIKSVSPLITLGMNDSDRVKIFFAVKEIPVDKRQGVVDHALPLISSEMDALTRAVLVMAIAAIPDSDRDNVMAQVCRLSTEKRKYLDVAVLVVTIAAMPDEDRQNVIDRILQLVTPEMIQRDNEWHQQFRDPLIKPESEYHALDVCHREVGCLIKAVAAISVDNRDQVIAEASRLIIPEMPGHAIVEIVKATSKVNSDEIHDVVNGALQLIKHHDLYGRGVVIRAVHEVSVEDRRDVINHAVKLITPATKGVDIFNLVKAIQNISVSERDDVVTQVCRLITAGMTLDAVTIFVRYVAEISVDKRKDVIDHTLQLMTPGMFWPELSRIMWQVAEVPTSEERARFAEKIKKKV